MSPARLASLADAIDRLTGAIGRTVAWGALTVVMLQLAVVLVRHLLGVGSVWLHESVIYAHAAVIMLVAAWTLAENGHVRVDIFYADAPPRRKAALDLIGAFVFLIPFATALLLLSLPYVARSWAILEGSREVSGIPMVFLLKSLIPAFAMLMILQGASQAVRAALLLRAPRLEGIVE